MKTSFWRRWYHSLRGARPTSPLARAKPRRRPLRLEALEDRITPSLTPQMVLDINASTWSSNPSAMVAVGSTTFFTADDGVHGIELWKSDGTAAGTTLVKDIYPGSAGAFYHNGYYQNDWLTNVNGTLFFVANDGTHGFRLWKSDGTEAGTVLVQDIGSGPTHLTNVNGTLFFSAYDATNGYELWKSDGTAAGTTLVKDIKPGWADSNPRNLTNVNGTLFFSSYDYFGTYSELWRSDGTAAGTVLVKSYTPKPNVNDAPSSLTNVNGTLYFSAYTAANGSELWKSDGTAAGTVMVKDIVAGSAGFYPSSLTNVNGTLFFSTVTGTGLWKSDGTAAGTTLVKDVSYPSHLTDVNGTLFFTAGNSNGLWKSDGTAAGTVLIKPFVNPDGTWSDIVGLTNVNGTLFFTANDGVTGYELWKSDGTEAGTLLVRDISPGSAVSFPHSLTNVNGTLMFAATEARHGVELWRSDGTAAGTALVKDINTRTFSSYPASFKDVNGTLFFAANDGIHGSELWKSDGTAAGTTLVKDIYPGGFTGYYGYYGNSSSLSNLTNVNGTLFFTAEDGTHGYGLWKSDGTEAGTVLVRSLGWGIHNLTNVHGTLFFTAGDSFYGSDGVELWKSDGTTAGTTLVKDIYPGTHVEYDYGYYGPVTRIVPNSSSPGSLTNVNGTLFFTATDGTNGRELWKSDGTDAGTVLVKDIRPGTNGSYPNSSNPGGLTDVNGTLFFRANDGSNGSELWKSDGSEAGTVLVKDLCPGTSSSYPYSLTNINGTLFFSASDGTNGSELWRSDGTATGTVLVKDIRPGSIGSGPSSLTNVSGTLFFSADNGTTGRELWRSDGTAAGTALVKDLRPGVSSSYLSSLTNVNGTLFFSAHDGTGTMLWQSDGSEAGTVPVANLSASGLTSVNGTLFFSAYDAVHGTELWTLVDDGQTQDTSLAVSGFSATVTAGAAGSLTVTVKYADGTPNTSYRGTISFTSSDPQAVLPGSYTFTEADQGVRTFSATLKTAGSQSITARDAVVPAVAGTQTAITVNPAAASRFTVAGFPSPVTAGVAGSFTVAAWDAYGNRATGYTGTVRFTSSDAKAVLPGTYTFGAADAGLHTFSATLKTAGYQSLTATDTANAALGGTQGDILVKAAAASRLVLSAPAKVKANAAFSLTVTVVDAYGNVVTDYRGTLSFSSSDRTASLPRNYTFTAADQGVHTFTNLKLKKKGKQTITVTDVLDGTVIGSVIVEVL